MASITIRNLDESVKEALRVRAAENGHSMEEEARLWFAQLSGARGTIAAATTTVATQAYKAPPIRPILKAKRILLVITAGIAAYKALDLIRRLRERGANVRVVMTEAAKQFVTPMSVGAISGSPVFSELWDRDAEHDIGHIRLARETDLVLVAPATADFMAKMAHGSADDLASTILLATTKPVLIAPAMNPKMWEHPATSRNRRTLLSDGIRMVGPNPGEMAESGEAGFGRMAEPLEIVAVAEEMLDDRPKPLRGKTIIVTSGPTHEPIDPVRYIANRSSGKQGHAIAAALADLGARVRLVSGPVSIADPLGVDVIKVESARDMHDAVHQLLPADAAIFVAAVADYRPANQAGEKIKKERGGITTVELAENPDILASVGNSIDKRPRLVIGFAAETQSLIEHGTSKLKRKGADFIIANDVSTHTGIGGSGGVMGGDRNRITLISRNSNENWPEMSKDDVAARLASLVAEMLDEMTA